jgi:hypothetical protein
MAHITPHLQGSFASSTSSRTRYSPHTYLADVTRFEQSLMRAIDWVTSHQYKAYEPADGNSSVLFHLTGGRVLPMRILQQIVLRSPINIRPLLGVRAHESAIGRGYLAWAYLTLYRQNNAPAAKESALSCLQWLIDHRAGGYDEFCWGDPYEYATRSGRRPFGEPLLIWTALIGQTFIEAYETIGDQQYLKVATSCARWVTSLPVEQTATGACLSYNAYTQSSIHNANLMGAAFLARLSGHTGDSTALAAARSAVEYSCTRQRPDGAWFYAEAPKYHWIDNFHTGYNLSALAVYRMASGDHSFDHHFSQGLTYFKAHLFEADGRPKYFHDRTYPVDIQCAAQAIDTLVHVSDWDAESLPLAMKVADWTIAHMQVRDGHFAYRDLGWILVRTPMLHWGQGTMIKALASLVDLLKREP